MLANILWRPTIFILTASNIFIFETLKKVTNRNLKIT